MNAEEASQLLGYDSWATSRMLSAAEELTQEKYEAQSTSSFSSVRATLAHVVEVQWIWLRRWLGETPTYSPAWAEKPTISELRRQLSAVETERGAFLSHVTDATLQATVSYRAPDGKPFAHSLGQLIQHAVNHGTYHRGQVATLLRQQGCTPPSTDLTRYLREAN